MNHCSTLVIFLGLTSVNTKSVCINGYYVDKQGGLL